MADRAPSDRAGTETIHDRPTIHQLLIAGGVLLGAAAGAFLVSPGFGVLIVTLAAVAAALWISYAVPPTVGNALPASSNETHSIDDGSHTSSH